MTNIEIDRELDRLARERLGIKTSPDSNGWEPKDCYIPLLKREPSNIVESLLIGKKKYRKVYKYIEDWG